MKFSLLLIVLLLPLQLLAQGKFDSEAPFLRLDEIVIKKEKKKKGPNFRKLRKSNKIGRYKMILKTALKIDAHFLNTRRNYRLDIVGDRVMYNDLQVGNYGYSVADEQFQNTIQLQQGENVFWQSYEQPVNHRFESSLNQHRVFGGSIEWRFLRKDRMGPPQGFFINTGILLVNQPVNGLKIEESEILFPVGIGFIIPGDEKLRVEIATNGVIGTNGSAGVKFDFSFVYQDTFKFGPGFIYTQSTIESGNQASGLGFHFGVMLPKLEKSNRRRR